LHLDGSPHVIRLQRSLYGTSMPGAGAVHHIKTGNTRRKQMTSDLPPEADIRRAGCDFRVVPNCDIVGLDCNERGRQRRRPLILSFIYSPTLPGHLLVQQDQQVR
jgi:hypothetical protein